MYLVCEKENVGKGKQRSTKHQGYIVVLVAMDTVTWHCKRNTKLSGLHNHVVWSNLSLFSLCVCVHHVVGTKICSAKIWF